MKKNISLIILSIFLLSACGGTAVYKDVFKTEKRPNVRTFNASVDDCWLAVSRAVLSQNFKLEKEDTQTKFLQASKYFQEGKKTITLTFTARVKPAQPGRCTVYANAVQTVERLHVKKDYFWLLIIPTPIVTSSEATTVKEEEETVEDKNFYKRLFDSIGREVRVLTAGYIKK